jgi:hypothetical protein
MLAVSGRALSFTVMAQAPEFRVLPSRPADIGRPTTLRRMGRSTVGVEAIDREDDIMRITVLTVADCPNGPVAHERIAAALDGRAAEVELVEVGEEADAARWGMTGSPTILLDGVDPFAQAGATPSLSCRIYRSAGRMDGAPTVAELRTALTDAGMPETPND